VVLNTSTLAHQCRRRGRPPDHEGNVDLRRPAGWALPAL